MIWKAVLVILIICKWSNYASKKNEVGIIKDNEKSISDSIQAVRRRKR